MLAFWQTRVKYFDFGIKTEQPEWRRRVSVHSTLRSQGRMYGMNEAIVAASHTFGEIR